MPKETRLDDDALIYNKSENQTEKEKLKNMPPKKRIVYFWDYYRYHVLIFIVLAVSVYFIIQSFTKPKTEAKLFAVIINNTIQPETWDEYSEKVAEYLKLDPEAEEVLLNYNFYYNGDPEYEINMRQAFAVYLAASELDVVIAPISEFANFVKYGFLTPLSEQLPTDLYSSLTDKFYLGGTEDNPKVATYGIYMADTKLYKEHSIAPSDDDPVLIGIIANSTHKENATEFIRYLFSEK